MESILTSIKQRLGLSEEYEAFDPEIIMEINTAFFDLNRLGVGPSDAFFIEDDTSVWTVKTFLAIFAFSTALSIIATPIMNEWIMNLANNMNDDPMAVLELFRKGFFKHLVLIDLISDTVCNLALMAGIWFRIKTLKH